VTEARLGEALQGLRRICADVRFLGSYPRAQAGGVAETGAAGADADYADSAAWLARVRAGDLS
jgi:prephenate dehydratase